MDIDVNEYIKNLKVSQAPFECPIEGCEKKYKSVVGIQYHLFNYNHNGEATPVVIQNTTPSKKGRGRKGANNPAHKAEKPCCIPHEKIRYDENANQIEFKIGIEGKFLTCSVEDEIPVISTDVFEKMTQHSSYEVESFNAPDTNIVLTLPEAVFKEIDNYNICDAPMKPNSYIRFIEKSIEELDGEIDLEVDEEDTTWLATINQQREEQGLNPISVDQLELLMDRLEKESHFQAASNGQAVSVVDEDAICCICMDGECQNTNVILFCDMCNLAVHQDCYGVPYIPEGQWLCRRCLQSPSRPVECVLCPNSGGAFKQTDQQTWAHVICALWIPEVRFANTVFLEPIDSIETIPPARWKLVCYICKQKGIGACIQCNKNFCYQAFHVTCAQYAGLCMRMETVKVNESEPMVVQKMAFCDKHTPSNFETDSPIEDEKKREECRNKMKQARKLLAKKRSSAPVILIPTIPQDRIQEISSLVNIQKKSQFIQRLIAYWTLKRQYRNGVPLLRRLQSTQTYSNSRGLEGSPDARELYKQLKYWQSLRQDLERARLLCELVRKREKLKLVLIKTTEECVLMQLNPLGAAMNRILDQLVSKDTLEIFLEPVNINEVLDYTSVIKHPMDLGTMREKLKDGCYTTIDDLEADFNLMIRNCLLYNNKDTIFYKAGVKMKEAGASVFRQNRRELEKSGLIEAPLSDREIIKIIDEGLEDVGQLPATNDTMKKLEALLNRAGTIKHGMVKGKKLKQIRSEISKLQKMMDQKSVKAMTTDSSQSEGECESKSTASVSHGKFETTETKSVQSESSKSFLGTSAASSSGVNRRNAVLFTRKQQSNQKKPEKIKESALSDLNQEKDDNNFSARKKATRSHKTSESLASDSLLIPLAAPAANISIETPKFDSKIPDSFRVYRGQEQRTLTNSDASDESDSKSTCSSCMNFSGSYTDSEYGSSGDRSESGSDILSEFNSESESNAPLNNDGESTTNDKSSKRGESDDESRSVKKMESASTCSSSHRSGRREMIDLNLKPLQLVWAKCRGYPWYPALIMDPDIPEGFVHNNVPLPCPPKHVLELQKNHTESVFLVLFFDVKRTWQWLPPSKLELLGIEKSTDESKLSESKKPQERKQVKKAYQEALHYKSQVSRLKPEGKL